MLLSVCVYIYIYIGCPVGKKKTTDPSPHGTVGVPYPWMLGLGLRGVRFRGLGV